MISFRFVDGDWRLAGNGRVQRATDSEVLNQDIGKILNTDKQNALNGTEIPFRYNEFYGHNINFVRALRNLTTVEATISAVKGEVKDALMYLMGLHVQKRRLGLSEAGQIADAEVIAYAERITENNIEKQVIKYNLKIATMEGNLTEVQNATEV
jgi:hypothetical protein